MLEDSWTVKLNVSLGASEEDDWDEEDVPVEPIMCKCGKEASSVLIGIEAYQGICSECMGYNKPSEFTCEFGGGFRFFN